MRAIAFGLLAAVLAVEGAEAQTDTESANHLLPGCQMYLREQGVVRSPFEVAMCLGLIDGLTFVTETFARFLPASISSCPPRGVTKQQQVRVVVAYIERRPERMHEPFKILALQALHEAWHPAAPR
jgi:hypothetical protein